MTRPPKTPEEALAAIRAAAAEGNIKFAPDSITAQYNTEIQRIFSVVYEIFNGKAPTRPIWVADGTSIGGILERAPDNTDYTFKSYATCLGASQKLGITINPRTLWEDAGAALRALDSKAVRSSTTVS